MRYTLIHTALILGMGLTSIARAGLPEPDAVLYGTITLDGKPVVATDDVQVIARVDGVPDAVGTYQMGSQSDAGNSYALHIRVESLADGSAQSSSAAIIGQTAHIFVKAGRGVEKLAADFAISERGITQERNLVTSTGDDCNGNTIADSLDIGDGYSKDCNGNGIPDECESPAVLTGPACPSQGGGGGGGGGGPTLILTTKVVSPHGSIKTEPKSSTYASGTIVTLVATPDSGYRVKAWTGTNNDASTQQTNAVTMTTDKTVTVEFEAVSLTASATADATFLVAGQSTVLHASVSGGVEPYTYAWAPTGSLSAADVANPTATPTSTTAYAVIVTDAIGQTAGASVTVTVTPAPSGSQTPPAGETTPQTEQQTGASNGTGSTLFPLCGSGLAETLMLTALGLGIMRAGRRRN